MTDDRFNQLLQGPLSHPLVMFRLTRLMLALRCIVESTGAAGEQALEAYCAARERQDDPDRDPEEPVELPPEAAAEPVPAPLSESGEDLMAAVAAERQGTPP